MIGTFWNLCSACPSMPVDKLHSEYRSTYRWHEYTGPRQEVIRRPPQPVPNRIEPAFPRRKKNPALAHRTHEFLAMSDGCTSDDSTTDAVAVERARMIAYLPSNENNPQLTNAPAAGVFKSAVSRISTEYRLQFAWPRGGGGGDAGHTSAAAADEPELEGSGPPRKSLSMGAIKPANQPAPTHKKRIVGDNRAGGAELEPLVSSKPEVNDYEDGEEKIQEESLSKEEKPLIRYEFNTEYKKKFRPFSQYNYVEGRFKPKKEPEQLLAELQPEDSWYQEVLELRRKAGEYKHRGWGTELVPQHIAELYNKQITLWEQVSRRSSLSALSLASTTPKLISKEEKDKENNKKSSPTKLAWARQSPVKAFSIYERTSVPHKKGDKHDENKKDKRSRKEAVRRHNLERSGGGGRSQSVGPTATFSESTSPKRSKVPASNKAHQNGPLVSERRPRPTTLATTAPSRTKCSSGSVKVSDNKSKAPGSVSSVGAGQTLKMRNKLAEKKENKDHVEPEKPVTTEPERERVVKSPPEPTRVKSPEQILMRSPEPVNWTVPLDTGKTFTVTQNVHEGDLVTRPHSEVKSWTPATAPPPAPQSAPPQLDEYQTPPGWNSPVSDPNISPSKKTSKQVASPESVKPYESTVTGTTLKCVDDPSFAFDTGKDYHPAEPVPHTTTKGCEGSEEQYNVLENPETSSSIPQTAGKSLATDVFEKARSRFDNFWGKGKDESNEKEGKV
ncbi:uncharacterized protein LOC142323486 isoform X2 [Lycorma delicatula]|uniref:uncharacterized protein LOC142323486 isoform X2 n=1 Tax=Lycorma delicatula TaxID=130591 RepID=UPI003F50D70F